ncbi:MAG: hypothetical protein KGI08_10850, partial [Thaumarchaeota archaeon]|nr:hypothetical protein [Nitrososphaerota archaeon]
YVKKKLGNNHPFPTSTLYELIPEEFKDKVRQKARLLDKSNKPKKKSKKDLEIEKLLKERDFHIKTIDELKIRVKPPDEKDKIIKDLEIKHQENITKILRLERDVKELNEKLKGKILS